MSESILVEHHVDRAARAKTGASDDWSARKKLCWFLIAAALAWSVVLTPLLLLN